MSYGEAGAPCELVRALLGDLPAARVALDDLIFIFSVRVAGGEAGRGRGDSVFNGFNFIALNPNRFTFGPRVVWFAASATGFRPNAIDFTLNLIDLSPKSIELGLKSIQFTSKSIDLGLNSMTLGLNPMSFAPSRRGLRRTIAGSGPKIVDGGIFRAGCFSRLRRCTMKRAGLDVILPTRLPDGACRGAAAGIGASFCSAIPVRGVGGCHPPLACNPSARQSADRLAPCSLNGVPFNIVRTRPWAGGPCHGGARDVGRLTFDL